MKRHVRILISVLLMALLLAACGPKEQEVMSNTPPREYIYGNDVLFNTIFANSNSNFALSQDGKVYAWGYNGTGVLGLGDRNDRAIPEPIKALEGVPIQKLAKGYGYTIALLEDNTLYGWGWKEETLLGISTLPALEPQRLAVPVDETIVDISTGQDHVMLLTESGKIWVWGIGNYGNIGNGYTFYIAEEPIELPTFCDDLVVKIVTDTFTNAAITESGDVYIWGAQTYSQEEAVYVTEPTKVEGLDDIHIVQVSLGRCAAFLSEDGKVYTWGQNFLGECGVGDRYAQVTPVQVTALDLEKIVQISSGSNHVLALTEDGRVFAWGYNNRGQTSSPLTPSLSDNFILLPYEITNLSEIVQIFAGPEYSIALAKSGKIYTWGFGGEGQLGTDNRDTIITTPTALDLFVK